MSKVPIEIMNYARNIVKGGFFFEDTNERMDRLKEQAIKAIQEYKQAKREKIERDNAVKEIADWVKQNES